MGAETWVRRVRSDARISGAEHHASALTSASSRLAAHPIQLSSILACSPLSSLVTALRFSHRSHIIVLLNMVPRRFEILPRFNDDLTVCPRTSFRTNHAARNWTGPFQSSVMETAVKWVSTSTVLGTLLAWSGTERCQS